MLKRIIFIIFVLTAISMFSSCKSEQPQMAEAVLDRNGNKIVLPANIKKIASMGPSNTEILAGLGVADRIIIADDYSKGIDGLSGNVIYMDMMMPDAEKIVESGPDVLFVTGMAKSGGDDPYKPVSDAGICVLYMSPAENIEALCEDIEYLASVTGTEGKGKDIIKGMKAEIESIRAVSDAIPEGERKTVYFEIEPSPTLYSFGKGVFLQELLDVAGLTNILENEESWVSVSEEIVVAANPDIILTAVDYLDDPVKEIMDRRGWKHVAAVQNKNVYYVDSNACTRPSQNIVKGLKEIAVAAYPERYEK